MCGRFAFYSPHEAIVRLFQLPEDTPDIEPRYNIAPTLYVPAVREDVARRADSRCCTGDWCRRGRRTRRRGAHDQRAFRDAA
jgi:putative SOS response-associated peptidase YedK